MKTIGKYIVFILAIFAAISVLSGCGNSQKPSPATDFEYQANENGVITIIKYIGERTDVVIPEKIDGMPVESISMNAFSGCVNVKSISFPDSITKIGDYAFRNCTSIESIDLPNELRELGSGAFMGCTSLKKISIPPNMNLMYFDMSPLPVLDLEQVIFEEGREEIDGYACFQTSKESNVKIVIPASVKKLSTSSFLINGSATMEFKGDCPEISDDYWEFSYIEPNSDGLTIYYKPSASGWDDCGWKDMYTLKPTK